MVSQRSKYLHFSIQVSLTLRQQESSLHHVFEIDEALSFRGRTLHLAYEPVAIDRENEEAFLEYWMGIMASAAIGKLERPTQMPMRR